MAPSNLSPHQAIGVVTKVDSNNVVLLKNAFEYFGDGQLGFTLGEVICDLSGGGEVSMGGYQYVCFLQCSP